MKSLKIYLGICLMMIIYSQSTKGQNAVPQRPQRPQKTPEQIAQEEKATAERTKNDWAYLTRYRDENTGIGEPAAGEKRVVFMGNSITEGWKTNSPEFFQGRPYFDRGISAQTTPQMLVRFRADVINLKPKVVVILAGTNDIAGNTGPSTLEMIMDNIKSMVDLAQVNGIKPIICSVLPAIDYWWRPGMQPAEKIKALNVLLKDYTDSKKIIYVDFYSPMVNDKMGLKTELSPDGVHPNKAGYKIMEPLVEKAIAEALK